MSRVVRKPAFCIYAKTKTQISFAVAAKLISAFVFATQILSIYEISTLYPSCVVVQPDLSGAWSETPKTGFLTTRLIFKQYFTKSQQTDGQLFTVASPLIIRPLLFLGYTVNM